MLNSGQKNQIFLESIDSKIRLQILDSIAKHYGITRQSAFLEVTDEEAENLLEYLTYEIRTATSLMLKFHNASQMRRRAANL